MPHLTQRTLQHTAPDGAASRDGSKVFYAAAALGLTLFAVTPARQRRLPRW